MLSHEVEGGRLEGVARMRVSTEAPELLLVAEQGRLTSLLAAAKLLNLSATTAPLGRALTAYRQGPHTPHRCEGGDCDQSPVYQAYT